MITRRLSRTRQLAGLILPILALSLTLALSLPLALTLPVQAQPVAGAEGQDASTLGNWHQTIGEQLATVLRSHDDALRAVAMQNLIVLSAQGPGEFDLTPAVPALLEIYADDRNDAPQRIMAVAALRAIGEKDGMDQLYLLSEEERRASREYQVAQTAVKHYYTEEAMEREEARSAYFLAKGDVEKAEQHAARAAAHRSRLG